jgi:hypothetical protein
LKARSGVELQTNYFPFKKSSETEYRLDAGMYVMSCRRKHQSSIYISLDIAESKYLLPQPVYIKDIPVLTCVAYICRLSAAQVTIE